MRPPIAWRKSRVMPRASITRLLVVLGACGQQPLSTPIRCCVGCLRRTHLLLRTRSSSCFPECNPKGALGKMNARLLLVGNRSKSARDEERRECYTTNWGEGAPEHLWGFEPVRPEDVLPAEDLDYFKWSMRHELPELRENCAGRCSYGDIGGPSGHHRGADVLAPQGTCAIEPVAFSNGVVT